MSEPAPADLELLRSFVNTVDLESGADDVGTPEQLCAWLVERELLDEGATIDEEGHRRALEFREAVRALALANGEGDEDAEATATFNRLSARAALAVSIGPEHQAQLRAVDEGLEGAMGHLVAILYTSMVDGTFSRLKGCASDTCRWLFYDHSKNRSKKWCDMRACGNVINARAYRRRHSHESSEVEG